MKHLPSLTEEFERLQDCHPAATRLRIAGSALGASVIRIFKPGTKPGLLAVLSRLPVDDLPGLRTPEEFSRWYRKQLSRVAREIRKRNAANSRILPGLKWGHAAKVLSLYLRGIVFHTRYFRDADVARIGPCLPVPIDGILIRRLEELGVTLPYRKIREIDTYAKFNVAQKILMASAKRVRVPAVWFDDNWAQRQ